MCRNATIGAVGLLSLFPTVGLFAQSGSSARLEWRRIGNTLIDVSLPALATGPVRHVWYSPDGQTLYSQTASGRIWETRDFETWKPSALKAVPVRITLRGAATRPEPSARVEQASGNPNRYYALGRFVYRSDDGGFAWSNLTGYRNQSILGDGLSDLALSPINPDEITVSSRFGVWRSLDGGSTWDGLNQSLPNLPATRLLSVPSGVRPAVVSAPYDSDSDLELEWAPGERGAWRPANPAQVRAERRFRQQVSEQLGLPQRIALPVSDWIYAGSADGRLFASPDRGQTWLPFNVPGAGAVNSIWANSRDPRIAVAALSVPTGADPSAARIVHTTNGGQFWEDITANLLGDAGGVVADMKSGAIYAATTRGVFYATADLANLVSTLNWQRISDGLPDAAALDVRLDENGNQLFVLLQGQGVYATMAPHRLRELSVVNAADFSSRPAAPGTLLSILGRRLERISSGDLNVPILGSTDAETQVQVPFEAKGSSLPLVLSGDGRNQPVDLPLEPVSPAIFVDRDGSPLLLDADSGVALDAMTPAKSGARIQILATGLGAVDPSWQTGIAAPVDNTPKVVAPVRAFVDREPVEVTRATLAPGYIGFYLIEIQLPRVVNAGPAELYIDAGNKSSNRVRLYLAP
ncbi:MAG: hypothetical protein LC126_07645 [Bryobacterales bacterium]|nr:hypothetical protein [Bryobacterales bacterium]